jgi:hypothetical protein
LYTFISVIYLTKSLIWGLDLQMPEVRLKFIKYEIGISKSKSAKA